MNSIRPLFTITILAIVAVFLYLKINEGPARPVADGRGLLQESPVEVPPLGVGDTDDGAIEPTREMGDASSATGKAPAWNAGAAGAAVATETEPTSLPTVPEIPALPGVATSDVEAIPPATESLSPTDLPANIPVATYPGANAPTDVATLPSSNSPTHGSESIAQENDTADSTNSVPPIDPAANVAAPGLEQATIPATSTDRYGNPLGVPGATPPGAPPSANSAYGAPPASADTFAANWPAIQAALDQRELARAHELLSPWYGSSSLTPAEQQNVQTLLSQLAGTVVYSTEHQLEPAHVVQPGETLEIIAAKYNVPWQLLAKINGVASASAVQAGQQLKVMRGPFSAIVDLKGNEVLLNLDDRYAGRFPIVVPADMKASEGEWIVMQKIDAPSGAPERSLLLRPVAPTSDSEPDGLVLGALKPETIGAAVTGGTVGMSPADANEIADILSVGSRVTIRR